MEISIDTMKSYATEANLIKALAKFGFADVRHIVVCTREGRFTAIFPASECKGAMYLFAQHGFMTLG